MGASVCALCQLEHQHEGTCEAAFTAFCAQFAPVFRRPEPRRQLQAYLRALLLPGTWKTGGQLARLAHDARPDAMQRLLYHAHWDAEQARVILRTWLMQHWRTAHAVLVLEEGFWRKKGAHSVGVDWHTPPGQTTRVYGQRALMLSAVSRRQAILLDLRLWVSPVWWTDPFRQRARIPDDLPWQDIPDLARAMLQQAWQQGMPRATVVGGPSFGSAAPLRAAIVAQGGHFLFEVPPDTLVRPYYPIPRPIPVHAALAAERGTEWAMTDVSPVNAQTGAPGWEHTWLIARRPSPHSPSTTYYLASGTRPPVHTLCRLTAAREAAGAASLRRPAYGRSGALRSTPLAELVSACHAGADGGYLALRDPADGPSCTLTLVPCVPRCLHGPACWPAPGARLLGAWSPCRLSTMPPALPAPRALWAQEHCRCSRTPLPLSHMT